MFQLYLHHNLQVTQQISIQWGNQIHQDYLLQSRKDKTNNLFQGLFQYDLVDIVLLEELYYHYMVH